MWLAPLEDKLEFICSTMLTVYINYAFKLTCYLLAIIKAFHDNFDRSEIDFFECYM